MQINIPFTPSKWLRDTTERVTTTFCENLLGFIVGIPAVDAVNNAVVTQPVPIQSIAWPVALGVSTTTALIAFLKCVAARKRGDDPTCASLANLTK
ncbi:hypothetical protein [Mycolicibacterium fortuitum]|uniref:hypothetical protein n=1 Tax=Mycolicibacterium fortuitum TaxID=1766 RepID=UPI00262A2EEE|nr:hypothetical protein [Mycolicibacterium fortuitum]